MREQLMGYLLGALDAAEHEAVELALEFDPRLRDELDRMAGCLDPLRADREHHAPPEGLAARTCEVVVAYVETNEVAITSTNFRQVSAIPARAAREDAASVVLAAPAGGDRRWSLNDLIAVAGVCAAAALLFFPAISSSRFNSQLAFCQNNLRQLGHALSSYSRQNGGHFPEVPIKGNLAVAGIYAPLLAEKQLLSDHRLVVCPASDLAGGEKPFALPSLSELNLLSGSALADMQRRMGGSYGYHLGHFAEGRHCAPRDRGRANFALMADMPDSHRGNSVSANHGGRGQNVLFEDGHVAYLTECIHSGCRDDIFLNDRGMVEAGIHEDDAVVAGSAVQPVRFALPTVAP